MRFVHALRIAPRATGACANARRAAAALGVRPVELDGCAPERGLSVSLDAARAALAGSARWRPPWSWPLPSWPSCPRCRPTS